MFSCCWPRTVLAKAILVGKSCRAVDRQDVLRIEEVDHREVGPNLRVAEPEVEGAVDPEVDPSSAWELCTVDRARHVLREGVADGVARVRLEPRVAATAPELPDHVHAEVLQGAHAAEHRPLTRSEAVVEADVGRVALVEVSRADELREVIPAPRCRRRRARVRACALSEREGVVSVDRKVAGPAEVEVDLSSLRRREVRVEVRAVGGEAALDIPDRDLVVLSPVEARNAESSALTETLAEAELVLRRLLRLQRRVRRARLPVEFVEDGESGRMPAPWGAARSRCSSRRRAPGR